MILRVGRHYLDESGKAWLVQGMYSFFYPTGSYTPVLQCLRLYDHEQMWFTNQGTAYNKKHRLVKELP
jgi:hypothetical protein